MIKVLNIISDTNIGGAGRALLNYLAHYDRAEFENAVILPQGSELKPRLDALGVRVIEADIAADKSFSPKDTGKLKALIKTPMLSYSIEHNDADSVAKNLRIVENRLKAAGN